MIKEHAGDHRRAVGTVRPVKRKKRETIAKVIEALFLVTIIKRRERGSALIH